MVCSKCGAEIADKAIVCYRCGTPTAIPAAAARPKPRRRPIWPAIVMVFVVIALAVWVVPQTPPDTGLRYVIYVVAAAVTLVALRLVARR